MILEIKGLRSMIHEGRECFEFDCQEPYLIDWVKIKHVLIDSEISEKDAEMYVELCADLIFHKMLATTLAERCKVIG